MDGFKDFIERHQKWLVPVSIVVFVIFAALSIGWIFFDFSVFQIGS